MGAVDWTHTTVRASDGVQLACYTAGRADAPVILLVHGYPDDATVWDSVAERLAPQFALLAIDVRGAGRSAAPSGRAGYRIDQLADDLDAVAASSGRPVHVLAHDWGSVQAWHAVTRAGAPQRYASFTSLSGPSLAYTGVWYRAGLRTDRRAVLRQALASWYVLFFLLPVLPEQAWRRGLLQRLPALRGRPPAVDTAVHGLEMYRANVRARIRPRPCRIPTQVLVAASDAFITAACATQSPRRWVADLRIRVVDGGHWTNVCHPERVSDPVAEFVAGLPAADVAEDDVPDWDTGHRA